jgi:hypothetical protein
LCELNVLRKLTNRTQENLLRSHLFGLVRYPMCSNESAMNLNDNNSYFCEELGALLTEPVRNRPES